MPDESRAARMIARASAPANVRRHQARASSRVSPAMKLIEAPPSTASTSKPGAARGLRPQRRRQRLDRRLSSFILRTPVIHKFTC